MLKRTKAGCRPPPHAFERFCIFARCVAHRPRFALPAQVRLRGQKCKLTQNPGAPMLRQRRKKSNLAQIFGAPKKFCKNDTHKIFYGINNKRGTKIFVLRLLFFELGRANFWNRLRRKRT